MSHSITVFPEGSFIRDLCLMIDDYTVFNNCAITKEELVFLINLLCTLKWEDTIKSITQVYLQQIGIKKIQIITKNKQNSHIHTIISEKKVYKLITIYKQT